MSERVQRAIILAAGNGKRMGALTADRPKAMLDVGGRALIDHQIDALDRCGIHDVTIVVGYQQDRLRRHLGNRGLFIENPDFATTNSLYSLWLAREELAPGALIMNADILVHPELLARLVDAPGDNAVLVDCGCRLADEEMKVQIWSGFAVDFGKDLAADKAHGENVGIVKFGSTGGACVAAHVDALIAAGHTNAWAPMAFRAFAEEWPLRAVLADGIPWVEIDFPEDLDFAAQVVAPYLAAVRSRRRL